MKTKQSAIDNSIYQLNGLSLTHFSEDMHPLSITTFSTMESANEEFKRVTDFYHKRSTSHRRPKSCALVYYNQLIIQL